MTETPLRKSKKGKHHSLKENRMSMSLSASTDDVFDGKIKKGVYISIVMKYLHLQQAENVREK